jgi:hypothetical protein
MDANFVFKINDKKTNDGQCFFYTLFSTETVIIFRPSDDIFLSEKSLICKNLSELTVIAWMSTSEKTENINDHLLKIAKEGKNACPD